MASSYAAPATAAEDNPPDGTKESPGRTINVSGGRLLPYGVYGVRDLYPYWGMRFRQHIWGIDPELSTIFVNAKNVNFYSTSLSFTFPDKFASFTYIPFVGVDHHYYSGHTTTTKLAFKTTFGFHLGLSPVLEATENFALRADFKFNFGPGLVLLVGTGLSFSF